MSDQLDRRCLLEMALRPLAALGTAAEFPQDRVGIEALIAKLAEAGPSEPRHFAYEERGALPRYDGDSTTWLMPAGGGSLRIRREDQWGLSSVAAVLHPDGWVDEFQDIEGIGVPGSALTDQARADREAYENRARERKEGAPRQEGWPKKSQARFRTENLLGAVAGPGGQDPSGPVVASLALYEGGVMVNYLMPRPPEEVLDPEDPDDPFAEPHMEAMFPRMEVDDGLGTKYEVVEIDSIDMDSSPLRARVSYAPGVPTATKCLRINFETRSVEIDLSPAA